MNRILKLMALALLTMIVLSPLVKAGTRPTFAHKPSMGVRHAPLVNHTTGFKPATFSTHHTPSLHARAFPTTNYIAANGVKFHHGVFYPGLSHQQWTQRYFSPRWKAWCLYCPSAKCWFYYSNTLGGYYPVSYIVTAPPVPSTLGAAILPPGGKQVPVVAPGEEPEVP